MNLTDLIPKPTPAYKPTPPAGTVPVMCVGHVVDAYEVSRADDGLITFKFACHHDTGATALCLDFGANWIIRAGETFTARQMQIDRAAYWLAKDA
jgi:hypothetical protein